MTCGEDQTQTVRMGAPHPPTPSTQVRELMRVDSAAPQRAAQRESEQDYGAGLFVRGDLRADAELFFRSR